MNDPVSGDSSLLPNVTDYVATYEATYPRRLGYPVAPL
jgi:hypothetical protein